MTARAISAPLRRPSVIPGFGLTLGLTLLYLSLIVLVPLAALIIKSAGMGLEGFIAAAFTPRAMAAYRLSFGTALIAAAIVAVVGLVIAWVLVRYSFPGNGCSTRWSTCRSRCRPRWPASRWRRSTPRTAGSARRWRRSG